MSTTDNEKKWKEVRRKLEIRVPKEIRDYQEAIFMGLSLRQCLFSLLAILVALGIYFGLKNVLGQETVSWICILGAFPFAALGFIRYHGMMAEQFLTAYVVSEWLMPKQLGIRPFNLYAEALKEAGKEQKKGNRWEVLNCD